MNCYKNHPLEPLTYAAKVIIMIIAETVSSENIPMVKTVGIEGIHLQLIRMLSAPLPTLVLFVVTMGLN